MLIDIYDWGRIYERTVWCVRWRCDKLSGRQIMGKCWGDLAKPPSVQGAFLGGDVSYELHNPQNVTNKMGSFFESNGTDDV